MPCRREAPYLSQLAEKYRDRGLLVLAVSTVSGDAPEAIQSFARKSGLKQTFLPGGSSVAARYGIASTPTHVYVDRSGEVADSEVGFLPSRVPEMEARIETLLAAR